MNINPVIKLTLSSFGIPYEDGLSYLLSVYFNCKPSYTPSTLTQKINVTKILGISDQKEVQWNIPLFSDIKEDKWEWVVEWNTQFGLINKERKGSNSACITRMKNLFAENPDIRKEEIVGATKLYFNTVSDKQYLVSSHYFITKGVGRDRESLLLVWVERYREIMTSTALGADTDLASKMQ